MSKFEAELEKYKSSLNDLGISYDAELLTKVTKGLGPSIYNNDSSKVSSSDSEELLRVKTNFLVKKLGLDDGPALDEAVKEACNTLGSSNPNKYRAIIYYLLVKKFNKEAIYN